MLLEDLNARFSFVKLYGFETTTARSMVEVCGVIGEGRTSLDALVSRLVVMILGFIDIVRALHRHRHDLIDQIMVEHFAHYCLEPRLLIIFLFRDRGRLSSVQGER